MTPKERRWFDNIKKAFHESDVAAQTGRDVDKCLPELLKAIDAAKTLRRSLRGEDIAHRKNKDRYIEFLGLEVPAFRPGEHKFKLRDGSTQKVVECTLGEIVYQIRCSMVHENENLNADEDVEDYIQLDWSNRNPLVLAEVADGKITLNGQFLCNRLREVLAKFITGLQASIDFVEKRSFSISARPPMGSIRPQRRANPKGGHWGKSSS